MGCIQTSSLEKPDIEIFDMSSPIVHKNVARAGATEERLVERQENRDNEAFGGSG